MRSEIWVMGFLHYKMPSRRRPNGLRRGIAATELALCLPVIVLLALGMIETTSMVFVKQALCVTAYEGAHAALQPNATTRDIQSACDRILTDRRINGATVTTIPRDISRLSEGQFFEIRVSAPSDSNNMIPGKFFLGKTLTASAVMMKEL